MDTPVPLDTTDEIVKIEATHRFEADRAHEHVTEDRTDSERLKAERRDLSEDASESVERRIALSTSPQTPFAQLEEIFKKQLACSQEQLACLQKLIQDREKDNRIQLWLAILIGPIANAIIGLLVVAIISAIIQGSLARIQTKQDETQADIKETQKAKLIVINSPGDGGVVKLTSTISGKTPFPEMHHYVVVTPVENRVNWISNPASVEADGSFTSEVQFGEGSNGIGKKFIIRILVTNSSLAPGPLSFVPEDAIVSDAITVTRQD